MAIPSGPYRASYDFSRRKRRNPDMTVSAPSGTVCIVPRYGDQRRQEAAAAMLASSLDMLNAIRRAIPTIERAFDFDGDVFGKHHNAATDALMACRAALKKAEGTE